MFLLHKKRSAQDRIASEWIYLVLYFILKFLVLPGERRMTKKKAETGKRIVYNT